MKIQNSSYRSLFLFTTSCDNGSKINQDIAVESLEVISEIILQKINNIDSLIKSLIEGKRNAGFEFGVQNWKFITSGKTIRLLRSKKKEKVNPGDQFRIALVTKPFTATAILKLVEMGKLSLDDTIDQFFPEYPNGKRISI